MAQLIYSEPELMRDHDYARLHEGRGQRMHGGFMVDGRYQPPRALIREPALTAWTGWDYFVKALPQLKD